MPRQQPRTWNILVESGRWQELETICMRIPDEPCTVAELLEVIRRRAGPIAADIGALYMELRPTEGSDTAPAAARFHPLHKCRRVISKDDRLIAAPAPQTQTTERLPPPASGGQHRRMPAETISGGMDHDAARGRREGFTERPDQRAAVLRGPGPFHSMPSFSTSWRMCRGCATLCYSMRNSDQSPVNVLDGAPTVCTGCATLCCSMLNSHLSAVYVLDGAPSVCTGCATLCCSMLNSRS